MAELRVSADTLKSMQETFVTNVALTCMNSNVAAFQSFFAAVSIATDSCQTTQPAQDTLNQLASVHSLTTNTVSDSDNLRTTLDEIMTGKTAIYKAVKLYPVGSMITQMGKDRIAQLLVNTMCTQKVDMMRQLLADMQQSHSCTPSIDQLKEMFALMTEINSKSSADF